MDRRIVERIEACRPRSEDLREPDAADAASLVEHDDEARQTYQRVQQWDAAIGDAMERVPVPEGLAERILRRLQSAGATVPLVAPSAITEAITLDRGCTDATVEPTSVGTVSEARHSRRSWLGMAAGIAAAVVLAAFVADWLRPPAPDALETVAAEWFDQVEAGGIEWQQVTSAPEKFPLPDSITATVAGWQRVDKLVRRECVAYKLAHPNAGDAILFVARLSSGRLPTGPPPRPQWSSQGRSVGYWKSGALVYMLVVKGDEASYRAFVSSSPTPLA
jgi:hypothetical protein